MALTNAEIDKLPVSKEVKVELKKMRQCPITFSNIGQIPSEAVWIVTPEVLESQIRELLSTYLGASEVKDVTLWKGGKTAPFVLVWLHKDSKHIIDSNIDAKDMVFVPKVQKFSDELKNMCDQLAPRRDPETGADIPRKKRIFIIGSKNASSLIGVKLDLMLIISRLYDARNTGFSAVYGNDNARPVNIQMQPIRDSKRDDAKIRAYRITKTYADNAVGRRPIPAFRDRGQR